MLAAIEEVIYFKLLLFFLKIVKILHEKCGLMDVHVYMMTHTIPHPFGVTVPAVIVLAVNKVVLVVDSFLFTNPGATVRTVNVLNIFFVHYHSEDTKLFINYYSYRVFDRIGVLEQWRAEKIFDQFLIIPVFHDIFERSTRLIGFFYGET